MCPIPSARKFAERTCAGRIPPNAVHGGHRVVLLRARAAGGASGASGAGRADAPGGTGVQVNEKMSGILRVVKRQMELRIELKPIDHIQIK